MLVIIALPFSGSSLTTETASCPSAPYPTPNQLPHVIRGGVVVIAIERVAIFFRKSGWGRTRNRGRQIRFCERENARCEVAEAVGEIGVIDFLEFSIVKSESSNGWMCRARKRRKASAPYSSTSAIGSMTLPRVLDIFGHQM